jgi:zinc protease
VFAVRLAMFFLNRLVTEGVPERDLDGTRQFLLGYTRLWDLTPSRRLGYALDEHFYGTPSYLEGYRRDLEKLTAAQVNAAIKRNLVAGPVKIAIVAPDAEKLKADLVRGEKSAKAYGAKVDPSVLELDEKVGVFPLNLKAENVEVVKADALFVR